MEFGGLRRASLIVGMALAILAAPAAVHADWRDDIPVLRVGVMTGANAPYRIAQLEPFRAYLEARLAIPVEIIAAENFGMLIDAQSASRVHYAIYSATAYSTAAATCRCVEPLAVPTRAGGEVGFHALLVARADGPIRSLADARGARLAVAGPDSVAGRLLQMKALETDDIVPDEYFARVVELGNPELAMTALLAGEADIAVAWSSLTGDISSGYSFGVLTGLVADGALSMDQIRIIWRSPLIPFGPHAVRSDLPDELKRLLSDALLAVAYEDAAAYDAVDRFAGQGFVSADADLFAPVAALISPRASGE